MASKVPPVTKPQSSVIAFPAKRPTKARPERSSRHEDAVRLADIIGQSKNPTVHRYGDVPPDLSGNVSKRIEEARHASALSAHQDLSSLPPEIRESVRVMLESWVAEGGPGSEVLKKFFS